MTQSELQAMLDNQHWPAGQRRARIIVMTQAGNNPAQIAEELGISRQTVTMWINRYQQGGVSELRDKPAARGEARKERTYQPKPPTMITTFTVVHDLAPSESAPTFGTYAGAQAYLDEVITLRDPDGVKAALYSIQSVIPWVMLSLTVENRYELYETATFTITDVIVQAPPSTPTATTLEQNRAWVDSLAAGGRAASQSVEALAMEETLRDWAQEHIIETQLTGVGHEDGDSFYDVTITASTIPTLVGLTFNWGY